MYKNKVLLSTPDVPLQKSEWDFIKKGIIQFNQPLSKKEFFKDSDRVYLSYVKLSDNNVNSIVRNNGQRLEFYNLSEMEKLALSEHASRLFSEFKDEMQELLSD